jgi:hypothetical protein
MASAAARRKRPTAAASSGVSCAAARSMSASSGRSASIIKLLVKRVISVLEEHGMTTPAPDFSSVQEFREVNRRMAASILSSDPAPYAEGGYVRRVLEVRGRVSGQTHLVPIAVISLAGSRYVVSPVRRRNWVQNLLADPRCTVRSRDTREHARAALLDDTARVAEVVSAYLARMNAPWAVAQFPFPADADRAQIESAADSLAVFRLDPDIEGVFTAAPGRSGCR